MPQRSAFSTWIPARMDLSLMVAFCSCLVPVFGSAFGREMPASAMSSEDYDSPFSYDYESLRIGGLVFAVTLFVLGLVLIFSRKCQCKSAKGCSHEELNTMYGHDRPRPGIHFILCQPPPPGGQRRALHGCIEDYSWRSADFAVMFLEEGFMCMLSTMLARCHNNTDIRTAGYRL
ncbi:hypothetical protein ACEWY4_019975 [Coilia grayii]|uniref:FXYD domain-containing ion transport regulator n=1 Tax=Coilia grayii TaxID=363190 RepID=A0ABD1JBA5_9TELE